MQKDQRGFSGDDEVFFEIVRLKAQFSSGDEKEDCLVSCEERLEAFRRSR